MKKLNRIQMLKQAGTITYLGVKVYKAYKSKPYLKDPEITDKLAQIIIERITPIVVEAYGIDMTHVTYSWGEACPYFYIGMADGITSKFEAGNIHVHYFTPRLTKKGTMLEPIFSIRDYAYGIAEIVSHELCHVKQFQNGLDAANTPAAIYEIPAYTMGLIGHMKYKKEVNAILTELGL